MLHELTLQHVSPHVGETFRICLEDERTVAVALVEATPIGHTHPRTDGLLKRTRSPWCSRDRPTYVSRRRSIGWNTARFRRNDVFIVPVGPSTDEVIFS